MAEQRKTRVKQHDIAANLGITQAAVSRALRGDSRLSADVIRKVHEAAQSLGYRKNLLAQSLISGRSQLVGYYAPTMASGYYQAMLRGIQGALRRREYYLLMNMWSDDNLTADDDENIRILRDYGTDGLLVVAKTLLSWEKTIHQRMVEEKFPVIFVNTLVDIPGAHCITSDDLTGGQLLMEHLFSLGHRQIAMAGRQVQHDPFIRRFSAYQAAMRKERQRALPALENTTSSEAVAEYLQKFPGVTAFLTIHDTAALELQTALERLGYRIPDDYSICGYGNDFLHPEQFRVPLTTIEQDGEKIGQAAVEGLLTLLNGGQIPERQLMPVHLLARSSTASPRRNITPAKL